MQGHEDDDFRLAIPQPLREGEAPLVSVYIVVFNHEKYLRECLEGVLMQQVNFGIEVIVIDDASTDGSAAIIEEYARKRPDIFRPILHRRNFHNQKRRSFVQQFLPLSRGKYYALCEGDDFWTNPHKLQRTFDFLEAHPDYSACTMSYRMLMELDMPEPEPLCVSKGRNLTLLDIFAKQYMHTSAYMGRMDVLKTDGEFLEEINDPTLRVLDQRIFLALYNGGRIWALPEIGSTYRVHSQGMWSHMRREKQEHEMADIVAQRLAADYEGKYKQIPALVKGWRELNQMLDKYVGARSRGEYLKALGWVMRALAKQPRLFMRMIISKLQ